MLSSYQIKSTLVFLALSYPFVSYVFKGHSDTSNYTPAVDDVGISNIGKKKKNRLSLSLLLLSVGIAVKMAYDSSFLGVNYYSALEVPRNGNTLDIRRAYKEMSKKYHPDKNPDATDKFQLVKSAYDILMDENQRIVYNKFGEQNLDFDPRKDEMKMISDIGVVYLFWILVSYIMTLPMAARASRTWITILTLVMLAIEVSFCLTETEIPSWSLFNQYTTEFEFMFMMHSFFPVIIVGLRCVAEFLYVDVDATSIQVLTDIYTQQKILKELLHEVRGTTNSSASEPKSSCDQESTRSKLVDLVDHIELANESTQKTIEILRSSTSNPGSNYYWILFVLLYGGVYFLQ